MIVRVLDEIKAKICDELLTKLIQDENKYDKSIDKSFIVKDYFKKVIKDENNILLCFYEDNIIKGFIFIKPIKNNNENGYLIDSLYVEEEFRNKSIAKKLIKEAIKYINNKNVKFIEINTLYDNVIAYNIYKKLGFKEFRINLRLDI